MVYISQLPVNQSWRNIRNIAMLHVKIAINTISNTATVYIPQRFWLLFYLMPIIDQKQQRNIRNMICNAKMLRATTQSQQGFEAVFAEWCVTFKCYA